MVRYIDADEYRKRLDMICGDGYTKQVIDIFIDWFMSIAESTESEDVAPVVHAYNKSKDGFLCSACTFGDFGLFRDYTPTYCPNCGAKMDEKEGQR